jgi:hypothetical protein
VTGSASLHHSLIPVEREFFGLVVRTANDWVFLGAGSYSRQRFSPVSPFGFRAILRLSEHGGKNFAQTGRKSLFDKSLKEAWLLPIAIALFVV